MVHAITNGSCIYKLYNNGTIVYIGQSSSNAYCRIGNHLEDKVFDSYEIINCDISLLNETEADFILSIKPQYNSTIPGNNKWISKNVAKNNLKLNKHKFNKLLRDGHFSISHYFNGDTYVLRGEILGALNNGN